MKEIREFMLETAAAQVIIMDLVWIDLVGRIVVGPYDATHHQYVNNFTTANRSAIINVVMDEINNDPYCAQYLVMKCLTRNIDYVKRDLISALFGGWRADLLKRIKMKVQAIGVEHFHAQIPSKKQKLQRDFAQTRLDFDAFVATLPPEQSQQLKDLYERFKPFFR